MLVDSGAYEAGITWGAFLALAGCFVVLGAAIARRFDDGVVTAAETPVS